MLFRYQVPGWHWAPEKTWMNQSEARGRADRRGSTDLPVLQSTGGCRRRFGKGACGAGREEQGRGDFGVRRTSARQWREELHREMHRAPT